MSIPFFSLGRRVHSITYTWSRNPSMDTRQDEPAWTTHARRIQPGQEIVINRDEDPAEGDLGMLTREKTVDSATGEKLSPGEDESGGSSSSTRRDEVIESRGPKREDSDDRSSQEERESAEGEAVLDEEAGDGRNTPPLAQYREGNHLVIERKRREGEEVGDFVPSACQAETAGAGGGRGHP